MNKKAKIEEKQNLKKILENAKYFMYCRINKNEEKEEIKYECKID